MTQAEPRRNTTRPDPFPSSRRPRRSKRMSSAGGFANLNRMPHMTPVCATVS
jgi:hypothetical protein